MRTRLIVTVAAAVAALAGLAAPASAINYMDQITAGSKTGSYPSNFTAGNSCMDDFEIFGTTGPGGGSVQITGFQAVFEGIIPSAVRVNIYHNNNDPAFGNLRQQVQGDVFSQIFDGNQFSVLPFNASGEAGNFPNSLLMTINLPGFSLPFGAYYLSIQSMDPTGEFSIVGSDNVTEGTPNDLVQVFNQGLPANAATQIPDNAAYRVMGIPTPGAAGVFGLGLLAAARRRRR